MYFVTCPFCKCNLDPGEECDCLKNIEAKIIPDSSSKKVERLLIINDNRSLPKYEGDR